MLKVQNLKKNAKVFNNKGEKNSLVKCIFGYEYEFVVVLGTLSNFDGSFDKIGRCIFQYLMIVNEFQCRVYSWYF